MFTETYGRQPADDRELSGFIARNTRAQTTAVAGYDLTFTPVKSVSALWAIAPLPVAEQLPSCHHRAVADALASSRIQACFTRTGADGIAQVDTTGLIAAAFTHRDSRAGDPDLHTHVAICNKVHAIGRQRHGPLAGPGRPTAAQGHRRRLGAVQHPTRSPSDRRPGRATSAASDTEPGKRPVREIVGVPTELNVCGPPAARPSTHRAANSPRRSRPSTAANPPTSK